MKIHKKTELDIELIKKLVVIALTSDDLFMGILVLKGGNALQLGYEITNRGSVDIDFSIAGDFTEAELNRMKSQAEYLMNQHFEPEGFFIFDTKFENRPEKLGDDVKDFWGGYSLYFKVAPIDKKGATIETLRKEALVVGENQVKKFYVDISKYEFVAGANKKDIGGAIIRIYSPEMLAFEKLRALCQQMDEYKSVVGSMTKRSRARDFYDIYNLTEQFKINPQSSENQELAKSIFDAKRVPYDYINKLPAYRELHRGSWDSVINTIGAKETVKEFDYYFDYVFETYQKLFISL